jgi:nucleotide-binding universal stress UspA family protein
MKTESNHKRGSLPVARGRKASCRCAKHRTADSNRILVAVDFSDCCRCAVRFAVRLARALKARLILLYVAETDPPGAELKPEHLADLERDLRLLTRKEFARLRKQEIPPEIPSETYIAAGRSDREILGAAERLEVDLIVMGTHSQASQHGQLGTTAGRVASLAGCPVVMVPKAERPLPFFI